MRYELKFIHSKINVDLRKVNTVGMQTVLMPTLYNPKQLSGCFWFKVTVTPLNPLSAKGADLTVNETNKKDLIHYLFIYSLLYTCTRTVLTTGCCVILNRCPVGQIAHAAAQHYFHRAGRLFYIYIYQSTLFQGV